MRQVLLPAVGLCLALINVCDAQLEVRNTGDQTIVMKYRSLSQFGKKMLEKQIPGNSTVTISLDGPDPYAVSYHMKGEDNRAGIHAKAGRRGGVPLQQMARAGKRYDIRAYQAAKEVNGQTRYQVTIAELHDSNGNETRVFGQPQEASEFICTIVNSKWDTQYRAINGSDVRATVDFSALRYGRQGSLTDVLMTEDDRHCYINARWAFGRYKGDVFFKVSKDNPRRMSGHYLTDGDRGSLSWNGSR